MIEDNASVVTLRSLLCNILGVRHIEFFDRVFISYTAVNPNAQQRIQNTIAENGFCCNILDGTPDQPTIFILDAADFNKQIERVRQVKVEIDDVQYIVVADTINHAADPLRPFTKALAEFTRDHHPKGELSTIALTNLVRRSELQNTVFKPGVYVNGSAIPF